MTKLVCGMPKVESTNDMISRVRRFCEDMSDEMYDQFGADQRTRFERIFVGKMEPTPNSLRRENGHYCALRA